MYCFNFFFQAEDGIRDLVRSRGLGDVYKRQGNIKSRKIFSTSSRGKWTNKISIAGLAKGVYYLPVSYTHLTLPTSDLV